MPRTDPTTPRGQHLTREDIAALPPMLDLTTTAALLGISRATAYRLAADNDLPVPVQRVGRSLRVPTAPLLALLALTPAPAPGPADPADDDRAARADGADPAAGAGFTGRTGARGQDARPARLPDPGRSGIDGKTPTR